MIRSAFVGVIHGSFSPQSSISGPWYFSSKSPAVIFVRPPASESW